MSENAKTDVVQTLHNKCDVIKEVLNKANGISAKIIRGPRPVDPSDQKEPAGTLESLANELITIQSLAESVCDYLIEMDEMI